MSIVLVGVNHKSAPVEVRELLALTEDACASGLRSLVDGDIVREGLIVSTCNRVEVLAETASERLDDTVERVNQFLSTSNTLPRSFFEAHLYQHTDDQAIRHLFRVTS
jgi:glutamyl-tRNA reductase